MRPASSEQVNSGADPPRLLSGVGIRISAFLRTSVIGFRLWALAKPANPWTMAQMNFLGANMVNVAWVALGGALGSALRFIVSGLVAHHLADPLSRFSGKWLSVAFPWGTLTVNVVGSLLIGVIAALVSTDGRWLVSPGLRHFLMLGVLGGFTTFSSFSLQTLELLRDGEWFMASANILLSVAVCLIAVWAGFTLASTLNR